MKENDSIGGLIFYAKYHLWSFFYHEKNSLLYIAKELKSLMTATCHTAVCDIGGKNECPFKIANLQILES